MNVPFRNSGGETLGHLIWWRLLLLVVVALVVLAGLVWGGKSAYDKVTSNNTPTTSTGRSTQKPGEPEPPVAKPAPSETNSSGTAQKPSGKSTGTLVNTGPGSTAAAFAVASTTGLILYQVVLRRQLQN